jgi:hypothetical protein
VRVCCARHRHSINNAGLRHVKAMQLPTLYGCMYGCMESRIDISKMASGIWLLRSFWWSSILARHTPPAVIRMTRSTDREPLYGRYTVPLQSIHAIHTLLRTENGGNFVFLDSRLYSSSAVWTLTLFCLRAPWRCREWREWQLAS